MARRTALTIIAFVLTLSVVPAIAKDGSLQRQSIGFTLRDDTYAAGGQLEVTQPAKGDLLLAGGQVSVTAAVGGDLSAAGGSVKVEGNVRDDLRVFGGEVTVRGDIGGDALIAGGRITITKDAVVSGDVFVVGSTITIEGRVRGNLRVEGTEVNLLGTVDGSVESRSQRLNFSASIGRSATIAAKQWYVGDRARIGGNLRYWQPQGERDFTGVLRGKATYDPSLSVREIEPLRGDILMAILASFTLFSLFSGALTIALLLLLKSTCLKDAARKLRTTPGRSLLIGLLYFIATPFLALLFLVTLVGIPVGLFILALYLFSIVFSKTLTAVILAKWIEQTTRTPLHWIVVLLLSVGIFIVLKLLVVIPLLGWLLLVLAVCSAFGALLMTSYERFRKIR